MYRQLTGKMANIAMFYFILCRLLLQIIIIIADHNHNIANFAVRACETKWVYVTNLALVRV